MFLVENLSEILLAIISAKYAYEAESNSEYISGASTGIGHGTPSLFRATTNIARFVLLDGVAL